MPSRWMYGGWGSNGTQRSGILECPIHLQKRLDNDPVHVADDFLGARLTKKKRCKAETEDRVLGDAVTLNVTKKKKPKAKELPEIRSVSSDASGPHMPSLSLGFASGAEDGRLPPVPASPIRETITWEGPPPQSTIAQPPEGDLKHQALSLIQRVPSRRGSLVDSATTEPIPLAPVKAQPIALGTLPSSAQMYYPPPTTCVMGRIVPDTTQCNDTMGLLLPQLGPQRSVTHVSRDTNPSTDATPASLFPDFLRKRFVPPRHHIVTEEIDRELLFKEDKDTRDLALVNALAKKQPNEDDKENVWSRLNELAAFSSVGFGFFTCKIGTGTYNRERKSTVLRQTTADRDALWDVGVRAPIR